jgi:hypothetical protein
VDNGAKVTHLGDIVSSLTSAMVGISLKYTNNGTMLFLNKASNIADRDFLYSIVSNASYIRCKEGVKMKIVERLIGVSKFEVTL